VAQPNSRARSPGTEDMTAVSETPVAFIGISSCRVTIRLPAGASVTNTSTVSH